MANEGFIKLYRKMLEWGWYDDGPTKDVFIHLLLIASYEDKFYRGIPLERGQVVTTVKEKLRRVLHDIQPGPGVYQVIFVFLSRIVPVDSPGKFVHGLIAHALAHLAGFTAYHVLRIGALRYAYIERV